MSEEIKALPDETLEKAMNAIELSEAMTDEEKGRAVELLVRPPDPDYIPKERTRLPFRPTAFPDPEEFVVHIKGKEPIQLEELNVDQLEFIAEYAMQGIVYVFQRPADEVASQFSIQDILVKLVTFAKGDGHRSAFKKKLDEIIAGLLSTEEQMITVKDLKKAPAREYFQAIQKLVGINTNFFDYISYVAPEDLIAVISILLGKLTNIKTQMSGALKELRVSLSEMNIEMNSPKSESTSQTSKSLKQEDLDGGISTGSKKSSSPPSNKKTRQKTSVS